ncbi:fatty acid desaturase [Synechococcus sp. CCY 9618]|uniref:fatty acid desaturase n=1 Tax=Synechococcus sp. CCY 9618 TaxID=2815602 RepID=UPI001C216B17|nr:fatty acid desaturase [Synechococcus sp. CCY 9618]
MSRGFWLGMLIFCAWLVTLLGLLLVDPLRWSPPALLLAVGVRTFLQTGLFILGHDAMHRTLVPARRWFNDGLGRLALLLYAALPYGHCRRQHLRHHRSPGSVRDPDFRSTSSDGPLLWYVRFMGNYLSTAQLLRLLLTWAVVALALARTEPLRATNVMIFWILPLVLSSFQLFLFGTYLPHRHGVCPGEDDNGVRSLPCSWFLSLLACYHFGYHREHHACPTVPWFRLPQLSNR